LFKNHFHFFYEKNAAFICTHCWMKITKYTSGALLLPIRVHPDMAATPAGDADELLDHLCDNLQADKAVPAKQPGQNDHKAPWRDWQS
jgi:hypothetical protein